MAMGEAKNKKNKGAGKKRARILRAAGKEFAQKGYAGARMDKIARAAGLDKASLYYYFRSKQDIYSAVLSEATRSFTEIAMRGFERDINPGEELANFVNLLIDFLNKHRSFALILRRELAMPGLTRGGMVNDFLSPLIRRVREYVRGDIAKGEMRSADPEHTLYSIFEILFGYFTLNPQASRIFFNEAPYSKEMIQRRKAHLTEVIRRLLAPEDTVPPGPPSGGTRRKKMRR